MGDSRPDDNTSPPHDKGNAARVFREAFERTCLSFSAEYKFDTSKPDRLLEQTRVSILTWNPGPRRGTPGANETHVAGKWHVSALQESFEYLQHETLTIRFHVSHCEGCAVLFDQETFYPDVRVSSVYIHDTQNGQRW